MIAIVLVLVINRIKFVNTKSSFFFEIFDFEFYDLHVT